MAQQHATALVTGALSGIGLTVVAQDDVIHTAAKKLTSSASRVTALQRVRFTGKAAANQIIAKPCGRI
jgi:NAD(P)-dependent dehydrogenase (short-subunit alcohol dehydrogenase family)